MKRELPVFLWEYKGNYGHNKPNWYLHDPLIEGTPWSNAQANPQITKTAITIPSGTSPNHKSRNIPTSASGRLSVDGLGEGAEVTIGFIFPHCWSKCNPSVPALDSSV